MREPIFYIKIPLAEHGIPEEMTGAIERVELRAHATELVYGEATYIQELAQKRWPELEWKIEYVRTARYVVRGKPKDPDA